VPITDATVTAPRARQTVASPWRRRARSLAARAISRGRRRARAADFVLDSAGRLRAELYGASIEAMTGVAEALVAEARSSR
jgi:hypothetical protein